MLKRLSADQVAVYMEDWQNVQKNAPYLKQAVSYFSEHGFGLSLWINGFMHDGFQGNSTRMEYADGLVGKLPCPLDANFRAHYASLVKEYAATGVRLIFIDDDFRMHISEGIGCFCPLHMVRYRALLGDVTQEEVRRGVLDRKPNRYRTAWQKINGETLCDFARFLRREVDSVDATVRLGLCTSPTVLDMDGVKSDELACILAGGTRPFLRLIGAPYWARNRCRLNETIGCERILLHEFRNFPGDLVVEGDTYIRPRYSVPAAYLENFDAALRAVPRSDGILKYAVDYYSDVEYEQGYYRAAENNRALSESLREGFGGKFTGFCVKERLEQIGNMTYPEDFTVEWLEWRAVLPASTKLLGDLSIPYGFEEAEPWVVFGENGRCFSPDCALLDLPAARFLQARGVDVGLVSERCYDLGDCMLGDNCREEFPFAGGDVAVIHCMPCVYEVNLQSGAEITSYFLADGKRFVASYRYRNAAGQKFVVLCYDADRMKNGFGIGRNYYKQRLLIGAYEWLSGHRADAVCTGHPDLYLMTAIKDGALCVAFWNNSADYIEEPFLDLGGTYEQVEFFSCSGGRKEGGVLLKRLEAHAGGWVRLMGYRRTDTKQIKNI